MSSQDQEKNLDSQPTSRPDSLETKSLESSLGVKRIEIISSQYGRIGKLMVYFAVFLISYTYGLDGGIRYVFQAQATASYSTHSLLSTINVIRAVVAAAAQVVVARLSDVFGRMEIFIVSVLFYVVGTIIESQSYDVQRFAGGSVLYQIGYTGIILIVELIVADMSFLNWRLAAAFVPALPFIINTWISGNITGDLGTKWSWGIGMWAIILPVASIPLLICFSHMQWRAKKSGQLDALSSEHAELKRLGPIKYFGHLFWTLDMIGIIFVIAIFGLILAPFTLAGGIQTEWKKAKIIAPIVIGFVCIPFFIWWEAVSKHPIAPYHLLKDRGIWAGLIIAVFIDFIWYMQGDYMYTVLIVAANQSVKAATRITSLYSFVSVIVGTILGVAIVPRFKRLKVFVVFGTVLWLVSMGMLIKFRGGSTSVSGIIGSLCLLGFGAGLFTYPVQVLVQARTRHEHMAVITALYLASYNIGSALGASVSGAIWTQLLPKELLKNLDNTTLATSAYGDPFTFIVDYPWGTPERIAVVAAYQHIQKILIIVGTCLCIPLIIAAMFTIDTKLEAVQSLANAEVESTERKKTLKEMIFR
jgi:MFS transporter, SIT family, siderophore-iron:H+ symporter